MHAYDRLLQRLDAFIRRYYANQLLRGGLALLCCLLTFLLVAGVGEYFFYLPPAVKLTLLVLLVGLGGAALLFWVIRPLAGLARLGKTLSHEGAAVIAGRHFPEIGDKLLNVLQLRRNAAASSEATDLLEASIHQKASQIAVVPIARAIDLSKNKRFLPWLLPVLLLGLFLFVAAPSAFREASSRLFQPTRTFEKPAPFRFVIQNDGPLQVVRGGDFELVVRAEGNALPDAMAVTVGDEQRPMVRDGRCFRYRFERVTEPVPFRLAAAGFFSQPYTLDVVPKPVLTAFRVHLDYPDYTGRKDEVRTSLGDLTVPIGTRVSWALATQFTDGAQLQLGTGAPAALPKQTGYFGAQHRFLNDTTCTFILRNAKSGATETQRFRVGVIPDAYPTLQLQEDRDTATGTQILLTGTAGDDYGLSRVTFHAVVSAEGGRIVSQRAVPLPLTGRTTVAFQHYFDARTIALAPGQRLRYWVEAWDNDGVHGPKAARSEEHVLERAGGQKLDSLLEKNAQQVAAGLSSSSSQTEKLQEEAQKLQNSLLQSEETSWESKQALQELAERQEDLKLRLETAKKRFEENLKQREGREYSEDAKEKSDALKEQMDRLLNKELAAQMQKLQELMQQLNKNNAVQALQQMEQENKLFNMDLQRLQELMKKLEQQLRLEDLASKMDKLAEQEGSLKNQTDAGKQDPAALAKEQDALKKELEKALGDEMKAAQKEADRAQSGDLQKSEQAGKQAGNAMQQSSQQLQQGQKSGASKAQQQAQQKLQEMAQTLREAASGASLQQIEIDIRATRQILTNLVRLSFDEEALAGTVRRTTPSSAAYLRNQSEQGRLYGMSHTVRDSLYALSKRVFQLAATVNKETAGLEQALSAATTALADRRVGEAAQHQQYGMTHTNNLALMLNELLSHLLQQQRQAMQQQQGGGKGACQKPGGSGAGKSGQGAAGQLQDIITGQQNLGTAMQQAAQKAGGRKPGEGQQQPGGQKPGGQQGGQQPGGQSPGGKSGSGGGGSGSGGEGGSESEYGDAEQLARLAQQQAQIRRQVQALMSRLTGAGTPEVAKKLREIGEKMDRSESDLVNRRLTPEFVMRQSEILSRLLEADNALRQQQQDDKRASQAGVNTARPLPPELQQALRQRQNLLESYRTVPATLKPYYRAMVERYYQSIGTTSGR